LVGRIQGCIGFWQLCWAFWVTCGSWSWVTCLFMKGGEHSSSQVRWVLLGSLLQWDLGRLALLVLRGSLVPLLVRLVCSETGQLKLLVAVLFVVSVLFVGHLGSLQMRLSVVVILCLSRIALVLFSLRWMKRVLGLWIGVQLMLMQLGCLLG
jgi:hypothetical protein